MENYQKTMTKLTNIRSIKGDTLGVIESLWVAVIQKTGLNTAELISSNFFDPARRIYATDEHIYKIILSNHEATKQLRNQDLLGEFTILKNCTGIPGIPTAIRWQRDSDFEMLVVERMEGIPAKHIGIMKLIFVMSKLGIIIFRLAHKGISHNDIHGENVLITKEGKVSLIDFDQASRAGFLTGIIRSFLGIKIGEEKMHRNMMTLMKEYLQCRLHPRTIDIIKKLLGRKLDNKLPVLPTDASSNLKRLLEAWRIAQLSDASSPKQIVAYYSFSFEGHHFPGERPWEKRWEVFRAITNYSNKRILELGCNMSFLSCFLLKENNAAAALGVDIDANILESAKLVSSVLGVHPDYRQQDFDSMDDWEKKLKEFNPDIVFALNVLNWVKDKERFMNFLGFFSEVVFEGHDDFKTESHRFISRGFKDIKLVGMSERKRPIIHCRK